MAVSFAFGAQLLTAAVLGVATHSPTDVRRWPAVVVAVLCMATSVMLIALAIVMEHAFGAIHRAAHAAVEASYIAQSLDQPFEVFAGVQADQWVSRLATKGRRLQDLSQVTLAVSIALVGLFLLVFTPLSIKFLRSLAARCRQLSVSVAAHRTLERKDDLQVVPGGSQSIWTSTESTFSRPFKQLSASRTVLHADRAAQLTRLIRARRIFLVVRRSSRAC